MATFPGSTKIGYAPIVLTPVSGSLISQISFDIRDFIPGGIKPDLSCTLNGFLLGAAGTIRIDFGIEDGNVIGSGLPPDDALGANGDWVIGSTNGAMPVIYQKIDGHYVDVSTSLLGPISVTFTYQGWRAIGTVVGGRCVFLPASVPSPTNLNVVLATSTFTGDISY